MSLTTRPDRKNITKKEIEKIKAAFHKYMTDYVNVHRDLPQGSKFDSIKLPRCCGAQFISSLGVAKNYFTSWLERLHKNEPDKWPSPYNLFHKDYIKLGTYATAKTLQMFAYVNRNGSRPFLSCIQSGYQNEIAEALRKTGWKKAADGAVMGNEGNLLTMWTKDARKWEVFTK